MIQHEKSVELNRDVSNSEQYLTVQDTDNNRKILQVLTFQGK